MAGTVAADHSQQQAQGAPTAFEYAGGIGLYVAALDLVYAFFALASSGVLAADQARQLLPQSFFGSQQAKGRQAQHGGLALLDGLADYRPAGGQRQVGDVHQPIPAVVA